VQREVLKDDMEASFAELELQLQPQYFKDEKIRLKCGASLFNLHYSQSDDFVGQRGNPKSQKQGTFFGVLGGAPQIQSGQFSVNNWILKSVNFLEL